MKEKDFYGYTVRSNGEIINQYNRIMKQRIRKDRSELKLTINGKKKNFVTARLIYCVFNFF